MHTFKLWQYSLLIICSLMLSGCSDKDSEKQSAPKNDQTTINVDKLKEDIDFLFTTIRDVHPNMYAFTNEEDFATSRKELSTQINRPMTKLQFYKLVAPVVASLKSGHTFVFPPFEEFNEYTKGGGKVFPLSLSWDGQKPILTKNLTQNKLPIGGTILAINGEDAATLLQRLARYYPSERKNSFPWQLERNKLLRLCIWLEYGSVESVDVRVRAIDETVKNYSVKLMTSDEIKIHEDPNEGRNSYHHLPQHDTYLVKLNDWSSVEETKKFCKEVFGKIKENDVSNLIIDVRKNPGGNSSCAEALIQYITDKPYFLFEEAHAKLSKLFCDRYGVQVPEEAIGTMFTKKASLIQPQPNPLRFTGQIFVLSGVRSTSTTMAFVAAIKHFKIGTLIGEETADPTTVYGNAFDFTLPNSKLRSLSACQIYICAGSKNDNLGVLPDYEIKQKSEDTAKGIDTALQLTLDLIRHKSPI